MASCCQTNNCNNPFFASTAIPVNSTGNSTMNNMTVITTTTYNSALNVTKSNQILLVFAMLFGVFFMSSK